MTTRTRILFRVYGTEFCRALSAVALFQALPKDFASFAAVRLAARHDGLSLAAGNGVSAAIAHVSTDEQEGVGVFSIPHSQVKAVLAVFKRTLPKDISSDQYVLEVTATDQWITIKDVSVLFDGDTFTMAVPSDDSLEYGDQSETDRAMDTFSMLASGLDADSPLDLTSGVYFSPAEVARIARAVKELGLELHLRAVGRRLLAPISDDFTAFTVATLRDRDLPRPFLDERALDGWRDRLHDLVEQGAF